VPEVDPCGWLPALLAFLGELKRDAYDHPGRAAGFVLMVGFLIMAARGTWPRFRSKS